jgi:hypothetical protein
VQLVVRLDIQGKSFSQQNISTRINQAYLVGFRLLDAYARRAVSISSIQCPLQARTPIDANIAFAHCALLRAQKATLIPMPVAEYKAFG